MVQPKYHGDLCWCHFSINLKFPGDWRISGMSTVEIWWRPFFNSFWKAPACSFWMLIFREFFRVESYHWYISLLQAILLKKTIWWLCIRSFVCVVLLILVFVVIWCWSPKKKTSQKTSHLLHHLHHFRHRCSHGLFLRRIGWRKMCSLPRSPDCVNVPRSLSHHIIFTHTPVFHQPKDGVSFRWIFLDGWKNCLVCFDTGGDYI